MKPFGYVAARSLGEASRKVRRLKGKAWIKAGGIDVLDLLKEGLGEPSTLVSLHRVPELSKIEARPDGSLAIGALCTLHQVSESALVRRHYLALAEAAGGAATPQIRRVATIGGNLHQRPRCWYFRSSEFQCLKKGGKICYAQGGDNRFHAVFGNSTCAIVHPSAAAVALLAFGARLAVEGGKDPRKVALEDHFVRPEEDVRLEHRLEAGEVVREVVLPAGKWKSAYLKLKERQSFDWPLADVAVALQMKGGRCSRARVVLGAAAPVPWRARGAEAALSGKGITIETARAAAVAAVDGATPLGHNAYKVRLLEVLTRRAILSAAGVKT